MDIFNVQLEFHLRFCGSGGQHTLADDVGRVCERDVRDRHRCHQAEVSLHLRDGNAAGPRYCHRL